VPDHTMKTDELLEELFERGIGGAYIDIKVVVKVPKTAAGVDEHFQTKRERTIDEDELQELVANTDWSLSTNVDVMNDFYNEDKFTKQVKIEQSSDEDDVA